MNNELKIFELRWNNHNEKEWVAAYTNIGALLFYSNVTSSNIWDFDNEDEIVEIPKEKWGTLYVINTEYNPESQDEDKIWQRKPFSELMLGKTQPFILAGTMYD